ncbi:MAG TPA: 50S ribosomal protein L35 [Actinomycetota bacterium]|nr:50S ribosomal protein L35 [Actinomycetota bacterium]
MPKMKSHRGATRRFRATKTGKLIRRQTRLNHMLEKKTPAHKRRLGRPVQVTAGDRRSVRRLLGL